MLVFSRARDEKFVLDFSQMTPEQFVEFKAGGGLVEITCVDIRMDKVRIGTDAPRTVQVHRQEVYDAIRRETRSITSSRRLA